MNSHCYSGSRVSTIVPYPRAKLRLFARSGLIGAGAIAAEGRPVDEGVRLDEAITVAHGCPVLEHGGSVEVRPVFN